MLYKLVPPSRNHNDTQYIDGVNDDKVISTLGSLPMSYWTGNKDDKRHTMVTRVAPKKVGQGQVQIGYIKEPQFAIVRVENARLAMLTRVAGRLSLGPAQRGPQEEKASETLKRMKKFRKRLDGSLNTAVEVAAGLAKQMKRDMFVWQGNSYMHAVWNVADNEAKALGPLENIGQFVFKVTPELDMSKHAVQGRVSVEE